MSPVHIPAGLPHPVASSHDQPPASAADAVAGASPPCWLRTPDADDARAIGIWFSRPAVSQWFDFGLGRQELDAPAVLAMAASGRHLLRVFGQAGQASPCGLVAISEIRHAFGCGSFWVARDALCPAYAGITRHAAVQLLHEAFAHYALRSVSAWAVQENLRSQHLLGRLGFRRIGVQRRCHLLNGQPADRILYDLLPVELATDDASHDSRSHESIRERRPPRHD